MKTILFTLAIVLISGSVSLAQRTNNPAESAAKLEQMRVDLELTDEQYQQIIAIHQSFQTKRPVASGEAPTADEKAAMQQYRKAERDAIYAVLTPTQQQKANAMRKQHKMKPVQGVENSPKSLETL